MGSVVFKTPAIMDYETLCKYSEQLQVVNHFGKTLRLKQRTELSIHLYYQNQVLKW